jgi:hypothetical protein
MKIANKESLLKILKYILELAVASLTAIGVSSCAKMTGTL